MDDATARAIIDCINQSDPQELLRQLRNTVLLQQLWPEAQYPIYTCIMQGKRKGGPLEYVLRIRDSTNRTRFIDVETIPDTLFALNSDWERYKRNGI